MKSISFETLQNVCKYKNDNPKPDQAECTNDDNCYGACDCNECPIWNDLKTSEISL